jgi:hypothetical protein
VAYILKDNLDAKRPGVISNLGPFYIKLPATSYSPTATGCSTIGAEGLNFRVRYGIGCGPFAIATGKLNFQVYNQELYESQHVFIR